MFFEPTTLAATATAFAAALETYGCDPAELFERAGLDLEEMRKPGARYPLSATIRLWQEARDATGDPCLGLVVATHLKPQALHAVGLSWLMSRSVLDGLQRLVRYSRVANTSLRLRLLEEGEHTTLVPEFEAGQLRPTPESVDAIIAVIVRLSRLITDEDFAPHSVSLDHGDDGERQRFRDFFRAPVVFDSERTMLRFDALAIRQPVPAGNEELARETDRIAERYLAALDPALLQGKVREMLLSLLPSGDADQRTVAKSLHRSVSALQRQLKSEGYTYRQLLDDTRRELAEQLMRDHYTFSEIAYLLGFSDQANFSRAFKRWTGRSPSEFR